MKYCRMLSSTHFGFNVLHWELFLTCQCGLVKHEVSEPPTETCAPACLSPLPLFHLLQDEASLAVLFLLSAAAQQPCTQA